MSEEEQEKLYELLFKDTKNKLEETIEKQQKEIETLETLLQGNLYEMYKYYKGLANSYQANCISKDKIREKIKELEEKSDYWNCDEIEILKELLEEK